MRATLHQERKSATKQWSVAAISSVLHAGLYARLVHDWDSYIGLPLRGAVVYRVDESGCVLRALVPFPGASTPRDYATAAVTGRHVQPCSCCSRAILWGAIFPVAYRDR